MLKRLLVSLFLLLVPPLYGADYIVSPCSSAGLDTAIAAATSSGDGITVPSGCTITLTALKTWTAPPNAYLRGEGDTVSIIVDSYSADSYVLAIDTHATGTFRLYDIQIKGGALTGSPLKSSSILLVDGNSASFRMDHTIIDFTTYTGASAVVGYPMRVSGCIRGVIDHNHFDGNAMLIMSDTGCNSDNEGDGAWANPTGSGGADFLFVEDNELDPLSRFCSIWDTDHGARIVVRNNTVPGCGGQTHPTGAGVSNRGRGTRATEFYRNTVTANTFGEQFNCFFMSSGTLLNHNNVISTNACKHYITLHALRRTDGTYSHDPTPGDWGYCGTSFNGTGSNWDENLSATTGRRCLDQPGNGRGDLLTGAFPNVTNNATSCTSGSSCAWPRQAVEPIYVFNNLDWAETGGGGSYVDGTGDTILLNTHIYSGEDISTGDPITFNGTVGVGVGVIASRPATCTAGVGYWATNEGEWDSSNGATADGKMYICTATNTWTAKYGDNATGLPYVYPHPLVSGDPPPEIPDPPEPSTGPGTRVRVRAR